MECRKEIQEQCPPITAIDICSEDEFRRLIADISDGIVYSLDLEEVILVNGKKEK